MKNPLYFLVALVSCCLLTCFSAVFAQVNVQWERSYTGNGYDILNSAIITTDGGYLLVGESNSNAQYDKSEHNQSYHIYPDDYWYPNDYWIIKIDQQGNKLWDKTLGSHGYDILTSAIATADGGYLLAGTSEYGASGDKSEEGRGGFDYWIVKTDAHGNKQWDKTFGGSEDDQLASVIATADGGYLLAGTSTSPASGEKSRGSKGSADYWIIKIDQQGKKQWDKTFGGHGYDDLSRVVATADGGYLLAGTSDSNASGNKSQNSKGADDYWIVKINKHGNKQWDRTIGGNNYDLLADMIPTADGGYLLAGESNSDLSGNKSERYRGNVDHYDYWIVKVDKQGKVQWDKTFGGNDSDGLTSIAATPEGGYMLAGYSYSEASGDKSENTKGIYDYWIIKTNATGKKQWDKTIGGNMEDVPNKVIPMAEGGYLLAGVSGSFASGDKSKDTKGMTDYWVVKLAETENMLSIRSLTLINADTDKDITHLKDGDIIDLAELGNPLLATRANINPVKGASIQFELTGPVSHTQLERNWPYSLFGDNPGRDYVGQTWIPGEYSLTATPYMNGKAGIPFSISFSVVHSNTNASARLQTFSVEVYPVPSTGTVNIHHEGIGEDATFALLDFQGNVLLTRSLSKYSETLDLSAYKKGFYYLKIISNENVETRRLVLE